MKKNHVTLENDHITILLGLYQIKIYQKEKISLNKS